MPNQYIASQRSIHSDIIGDKRVNDLKDFMFITGHFRALLRMDNLGRIEADPASLRAMLFPRNPGIGTRKMATMAQKFHDVGLFFLYFGPDGEPFLQSARPKRQKMVGNMQRQSALPPPPLDDFIDWLQNVRKDFRFLGLSSHECYEQVHNMFDTCYEHGDNTLPPSYEQVIPEGKGREGKGREGKGSKPTRPLSSPGQPSASASPSLSQDPENTDIFKTRVLDHEIETIRHALSLHNVPSPPGLDSQLFDLLIRFTPATITAAIQQAASLNKPRWPYIKAILDNRSDPVPLNTITDRSQPKDYGPQCPFSPGTICHETCTSPDLCKRSNRVKALVLDAWQHHNDPCPFCELPRDLCTCNNDNPQEDQSHDHQR